MTPAEWNRVLEVFGEASELPHSERSDYVNSQCAAGGALRGAVGRLLAGHESANGPLDRPLFAPAPESCEDVWAGRTLNSRYRIERFLARGGMSTVYLARDQQLAGKPVIVKFLHAWARQYAWLKARFRQEMVALARIDHPAVVGVLDTGETSDGLPFLVIEYIDGVTLRDEMTRGPLALDRIAAIIREAGRAVYAAHSKSVLHRDLKPENIMLERPGTAEEHARLIDFGIARLEGPADAQATQMTQFAGTTPYMAPEQLRGKPCPGSDIYAMAVVAYEMLAGERPFAAASPVEMYGQQRAKARLGPLIRRGVPEAAARLIVKQLSFRVEDRSPSAAQAGEQIADALLRPDRYVWLRRRAMVGLAGGAAALVLGGGYVSWTRRAVSLDSTERVIELAGGPEPAEHGFRVRGIIENRAVLNADATGVEALRLITSDQGGYHHPLNEAQAAAANRQGWEMLFEAAVEEGAMAAAVDVPRAPFRYAVNLLSSPGNPDTVRLLTGFTPAIHGIDAPLTGPPGTRHRYALAFHPDSGADLWVDGAKRFAGYTGLTEYLYRRGPEIGVARHRSARGVGVFWNFRFNIGSS
jgi:serine/threonine-protein kinase